MVGTTTTESTAASAAQSERSFDSDREASAPEQKRSVDLENAGHDAASTATSTAKEVDPSGTANRASTTHGAAGETGVAAESVNTAQPNHVDSVAKKHACDSETTAVPESSPVSKRRAFEAIRAVARRAPPWSSGVLIVVVGMILVGAVALPIGLVVRALEPPSIFAMVLILLLGGFTFASSFRWFRELLNHLVNSDTVEQRVGDESGSQQPDSQEMSRPLVQTSETPTRPSQGGLGAGELLQDTIGELFRLQTTVETVEKRLRSDTLREISRVRTLVETLVEQSTEPQAAAEVAGTAIGSEIVAAQRDALAASQEENATLRESILELKAEIEAKDEQIQCLEEQCAEWWQDQIFLLEHGDEASGEVEAAEEPSTLTAEDGRDAGSSADAFETSAGLANDLPPSASIEVEDVRILARVVPQLRSHVQSVSRWAAEHEEDRTSASAKSSDERTEHQRKAMEVRTHLVALELLLNQVADYSKLHSRAWQTVYSKVKIREFVDRCLSDIKSVIERHGLKVRTHVPRRLCVETDRRLLARILRELLTNAVKYTSRGGEVSIAAEKWKSDSGVKGIRLTVRDNGPGIAPNDFDRVFEPFEQGNQPRFALSTLGVGLGLTLVRECVDYLDGSITVESDPGLGSVFTVFVPGHS